MIYRGSSQDKYNLELKGLTEKYEYYCIVKKKKENFHQPMISYDLYQMDKNEIDQFKNETLESFSEKYLKDTLESNEIVEIVTFYHEDDEIMEWAKPIKALIFEPEKKGYVKEIPNSRQAFKEIVEGEVEFGYLGRPDMFIVVNEIGMLIPLPQNRGFYGTFIVVGSDGEDMVSLSDEQIREVLLEFDNREHFKSKSEFLKNYFLQKQIERKVFQYNIQGFSVHIGTEMVIEYLLSQENPQILQMIELEIKKIENTGKNEEEVNERLYKYLEKIGSKMVRQLYSSYELNE